MMQFRNSTQFTVGPDGAIVVIVSGDGEVVAEMPLAPGCYSGGYLRRLAGGRMIAGVDGDCSQITPLARALLQRVPGHWDSAANPHFEVTDASRRAAELERRMARFEALERAANKRDKLRERAIVAAQAAKERAADVAKALPKPAADEVKADEGQS